MDLRVPSRTPTDTVQILSPHNVNARAATPRKFASCWTVREAMAIPAQHDELECSSPSIEFGILRMHPKALTDWVSVRVVDELCLCDVR